VELPARRREGPAQGLREAAVLLAIVPVGSRYSIPLIERPASMLHHPGQIALPGGRFLAGETALECALREAHEEIGLSPDALEVLGRLTPVPVPVSGHLVEVIVGWIEGRPRWRIDPREVIRVIEADPDDLAAAGPVAQMERLMIDGGMRRVPAYRAGDALVWGATALMLAEFLQVWRSVRR
jgi:8-oxo-dGTP pyrophosphatase MutT (NUDIX family)